MMKKIIIEGMSCNHCVNHVKEALSTLQDSAKIQVSLEEKYATVETSSSDDEIKAVIEEEGYDVINIENL